MSDIKLIQRTILQIIPAPSWFATYKNRETGEVMRFPLVCWALVQEIDADGAIRFVVGMDNMQEVGYCDNVSNFVGYEFGEAAK